VRKYNLCVTQKRYIGVSGKTDFNILKEDITFLNLQKGEVTLMQLNEIYNKFGFIFIGSSGKFKGIKKEKKN